MRNASIMALGGTPYYLSILYFFFLAKFIPPLKRMVLDSSKRIRVRNIIMGTALFLTGVQSYFIASLNLSIWDISLHTFTLQILLITLGSIVSIVLFLGVTRMVGFPGVLIFLLFDFILIRSVHFFATYKMLEPETFDLSPMKIPSDNRRNQSLVMAQRLS